VLCDVANAQHLSGRYKWMLPSSNRRIPRNRAAFYPGLQVRHTFAICRLTHQRGPGERWVSCCSPTSILYCLLPGASHGYLAFFGVPDARVMIGVPSGSMEICD
jgi:hypothetical protein